MCVCVCARVFVDGYTSDGGSDDHHEHFLDAQEWRLGQPLCVLCQGDQQQQPQVQAGAWVSRNLFHAALLSKHLSGVHARASEGEMPFTSELVFPGGLVVWSQAGLNKK